ncbi:hypothetical protein QR680_004891 [Steinernema hermaphroditum]|uniref:Uncharacterized protein n=1 Tax=Steinernema hermaphroditum TaxID=289476 RepID=A0AA39HQ61_9BILA|nr:hypothetical protein QR680_004891 [Steinernema hermaphroditum]
MRSLLRSTLLTSMVVACESIRCLVGAGVLGNLSNVPVQECALAAWSCANTTHLLSNVTFFSCEINNCSAATYPSTECRVTTVNGDTLKNCCCQGRDVCNSTFRIFIGKRE